MLTATTAGAVAALAPMEGMRLPIEAPKVELVRQRILEEQGLPTQAAEEAEVTMALPVALAGQVAVQTAAQAQQEATARQTPVEVVRQAQLRAAQAAQAS